MNDWLDTHADRLAQASGSDRTELELTAEDVARLLDLAGYAAHDSGDRTNAPLLCYLVGLARASGRSLDELAGAVRTSTS